MKKNIICFCLGVAVLWVGCAPQNDHYPKGENETLEVNVMDNDQNFFGGKINAADGYMIELASPIRATLNGVEYTLSINNDPVLSDSILEKGGSLAKNGSGTTAPEFFRVSGAGHTFSPKNNIVITDGFRIHQNGDLSLSQSLSTLFMGDMDLRNGDVIGFDYRLLFDQYPSQKQAGVAIEITDYSKNSGAWAAVGKVGFSAGKAENTSAALDSTGVPYVAYQDAASLADPGDPDSGKATVMKYVGGNWTPVGKAGFSSGSAEGIVLALDHANTPYVAFIRKRTKKGTGQ
ncbi:hypothetical protein EPICR_10194 [Candidatus Desulfarcum epimagneticum]|uniref:Lipoprotein n=1 Tax=uncultured Desulfobacteraceae bacterium TaxID=218296 RepID=A0A484HDV6_9BACT|nr:hypothetical protein EPICR_10194 [uncultured Desulfobacteraceae bacterium]